MTQVSPEVNKQKMVKELLNRLIRHDWQGKQSRFAGDSLVSFYAREIDRIYTKDHISTLQPGLESMVDEDGNMYMWVALGALATVGVVLRYLVFSEGRP